jgi:hypothetical protein
MITIAIWELYAKVLAYKQYFTRNVANVEKVAVATR